MSTILSQDIVISIIEAVLQRCNPAHNHMETCVGQTLKGDRCRKAYNGNNTIEATLLIRHLSLRPEDRAELSEGLLELAELILCVGQRGHQSQASGVAQNWFRRIVRILDSPNPPLNLPSQIELFHYARELQQISRTQTAQNANRGQRVPAPRLLPVTHAATDPSRTPTSGQTRDTSALATHDLNVPPTAQHAERFQTPTTPEANVVGNTRFYNCRQSMTEPVRTPTGHKCCSACISKWLVNNKLSRLLKMAHLVDPETECPICHEELTLPSRTSCGHSYCGECVTAWVQEKKTCPTCRQPMEVDELVDVEDG